VDLKVEGAQIPTKTISQSGISLDLNGLQPLLQRLDWLIQQAISALQTRQKVEGQLGISWLQKTEISLEPTPIQIRSDSLLAWLQKTFNLSAFDLDILAISLTPELDRHYERIYTYIQDEMSNKRPTVDMVLNLLCATISEKLSRRQHFTTNAPLIYHRLLHLYPEPQQQQSTLLAHRLILDSQVVRLLLHQPGLDSRLTSDCQLLEPTRDCDTLFLLADVQTSLTALAKLDWEKQQPLLLYFQGTDRTGKCRTAQTLAKSLDIPLLIADLARMVEDKTQFEEKLQLLWREAWFFNYLLYIENFDVLYLPEHQILYQSFLRELEKNRGITILTGVQNWIPTATGAKGLITVTFTIPESSQRREYWLTHLKAAQISIEERELDVLSDRFLLTPDQIADAVATAYNTTRWLSITTASSQNNNQQNPDRSLSSFLNLCNAARAQSGYDLTALARKIEPQYTWDDIILSADPKTQLREICNQTLYRNLVLNEWGFDRKLSLGKGLNALFSGQPGTGKTMAAEVIANELQLDLYQIDLSQIVSKYIGETEKNLNRIFTAAANSNAILLFDEADALFGKRSEVKDAHDRYANLEIAYLLQKMEEYEGIAILTTNFSNNIDDAFTRRLSFIIGFPFPKEPERHQIWQKIFPQSTPRSAELDLEFMARRFEIAGGNIRNIALAAAYLAAAEGVKIRMSHLIRATRREYQKMGKVLMDDELGNYAGLRT
jgi:AAA+ superfamily predicted ATPase